MIPTGLSLHRSRRGWLAQRSVDETWRVVAGAGPGRHWYVDAAPLVLRGALDRLVLGEGRRWPVPDGPLLRAGDRAGFWDVRAAGSRPGGHRLLLEAAVRAPGTVLLTVVLTGTGDGTRVDLEVGFRPQGLLGTAYLLGDLPAREAVTELVARRIRGDLARPGSAP